MLLHLSLQNNIFWKNILWFEVRLHHFSIISLNTRDLVLHVCIILWEGNLCWGFCFYYFINFFFLQFSGIIKTFLWQIKLVVIHLQISGFFHSPLTKCCFAACFRRGIIFNAGSIETSLETIAFLAESYPLWRPGKFLWKKRVLFWRKNHQKLTSQDSVA